MSDFSESITLLSDTIQLCLLETDNLILGHNAAVENLRKTLTLLEEKHKLFYTEVIKLDEDQRQIIPQIPTALKKVEF